MLYKFYGHGKWIFARTRAMQGSAQGASSSFPTEDYDIQSTYIPPKPQYDDPFAPASSSPFVINEAEATVPDVPQTFVPSAVNSKDASRDTVLQFHGAPS